MWMERLTNAMIDKWIKIKDKDQIDLYFMQLWEDAKKVVMPLSLEARKAWINTMASLWTPSMKAQLKKANRLWVRFVVIVGIMEAKTWIFQVKDMLKWTQEEVKKENIIQYIIDRNWEERLDFYNPAKDLYIEEIKEEVE
jgi:histidyl-tRNA synthetase